MQKPWYSPDYTEVNPRMLVAFCAVLPIFDGETIGPIKPYNITGVVRTSILDTTFSILPKR